MKKNTTLLGTSRESPVDTKVRFPSNVFYCGKVGHFVAKFPYKNRNKEEVTDLKRYMKGSTKKKMNFPRQKKNLYTNEDNSSSDDTDSEITEILFMGLEAQTDILEKGNADSIEEEYNIEIDAEVDLEGELKCALNEIERPRKKKQIQKK
jgi:hypothetical protein